MKWVTTVETSRGQNSAPTAKITITSDTGIVKFAAFEVQAFVDDAWIADQAQRLIDRVGAAEANFAAITVGEITPAALPAPVVPPPTDAQIAASDYQTKVTQLESLKKQADLGIIPPDDPSLAKALTAAQASLSTLKDVSVISVSPVTPVIG